MPEKEDVGYYDTPTAEEVLRHTRLAERSGLNIILNAGKLQQNAIPPPNRPANIFVRNVSGEPIPAFGCVQATGTRIEGTQCYLEVNKPVDSDGTAGPFFLNLFREIPVDQPESYEYGPGEFPYGTVTDGPHANALVPEHPDAGVLLQPKVKSWELEEGGSIFRSIGPNDGGGIFSGVTLGKDVHRVKFDSVALANTVHFELVNASGLADVIEIPCSTTSLPGLDDNGQITVHDKMGCLDLQPGLHGWAEWVQPYPIETQPVCIWSIYSLCCP